MAAQNKQLPEPDSQPPKPSPFGNSGGQRVTVGIPAQGPSSDKTPAATPRPKRRNPQLPRTLRAKMRRRALADKEEFGELFAADSNLRHRAGRFYATNVHSRRKPGPKQTDRVEKALKFLQQFKGPIATKGDRERRNLEMCKQCIPDFAKLRPMDRRYEGGKLIAAVKAAHNRRRKHRTAKKATKAETGTVSRTNQEHTSIGLQS